MAQFQQDLQGICLLLFTAHIWLTSEIRSHGGLYIYISIPITSFGACKGTSWQITFFSVCVNSSFGISNHKDFSQVEEIQLVCHPLYFTFQVFHSQQLSDRLPWNSNRHSWSWDDKAHFILSHSGGSPNISCNATSTDNIFHLSSIVVYAHYLPN